MPDNRLKTSNVDGSRIFSGDVSLDDFLRDYWQQKPLLIRNAFPDLTPPLTAEELAGLACEDSVNARIIIEKDAETPWSVKYSPLDENDFTSLPETHWTLLVSDVEKYVPQVRSLKDCFRFIPDWRMDDLMFSYAPEGGSVGPHLDAYDVFLLQVSGRRNWMISKTHENRFLENTELSILSSFSADESWVLEAGDMLYLPPGIAHHGVAIENCVTCSIGFRAPSVRAMTSEFAEYIANHINNDVLYTDPGLQSQEQPSEISPSALNTIKHLLAEHLDTDDHQLQRWFGEYTTQNRSSAQTIEPAAQLQNYRQLEDLYQNNAYLHHAPTSKFLFSGNDKTLLFVDGNSYPVSRIFAETICAHHCVATAMLNSLSIEDKQALLELYNEGSLYFADENH